MPATGDDTPSLAHDALALLAVPRIGAREWHKRTAAAGSPGAVLATLDASTTHDARALATRALQRAATLGATVLACGDTRYPARLHDLTRADDPSLTPAPPVLFALGDLTQLALPAVAIVGTRHATATGLRAAARIARDCADAGAIVISGLARGIDAAAHTGALDTTGRTAGIIGTGIDIAYPADHRALQRRIATSGLLLTEHAPGERANRGSFPERNRLIAALADLTIVVEAGHRSGALLTATAAQTLNRACAAVPGPFDSAASLGANHLLRDGAHVIASTDDALALLQLARADTTATQAPPTKLSEPERAIWDVLGSAPLALDLVVERAGWAADACLAAVTTLELKGLVRATHDGALLRA